MDEQFDQYLTTLKELDPQDIVAEIDIDSNTLVDKLEEYIYDKWSESKRSDS